MYMGKIPIKFKKYCAELKTILDLLVDKEDHIKSNLSILIKK